MAESIDLEISTLNFDEKPTERKNPFTGATIKAHRRQPFSADEVAIMTQRFNGANAKESKEEGWIDISVGMWKAHVEFDKARSTLAAFRMECSGLPTGAAADLLFTVLNEANAYMAVGTQQAGPHKLLGVGAKAMLDEYREVHSPSELSEWIQEARGS